MKRKGTNGRKPKYEEIEPQLYEISKEFRSAGILVNKYLLKEARIIAEAKGIVDFIGTPSWLDGFKKRYEIVYRKPTRVAQKLKDNAEEELKKFQEKYIELLKAHNYHPDAIVNIDETGICMDMPSNQTLNTKVSLKVNEITF